jgi:CHAD domain-containing protein
MSGELPSSALAGMGYTTHARRQVTDHVTFYDTHDGTFMKKGFTVTYSRTAGTWRVREDGAVVAEEKGPQSALPLDGALGRALGSIPAAHPTIPLLDAALVQSDYSLAGFAADSLHIRARRWTFHSPIQVTAPRSMLRLVASGPPSTLGYFSSVLRERLGFLPARTSIMAKGLALLGLCPPGAGAPGEFRVSPEDSVAQTCRRIFRGEAWRMRMNAPGAIGDLDPEFVHDLRVATRRARSASRIFAFILDPDHLQKLRDGLRWIAQLLGGVRDLDVLAARLETQVRMTASEIGFSGLLRERLQAKRDRALAELIPALESDRFAGLLSLLESTGDIIPSQFEAFGQDAAPLFARKRIDKAFRKLSPWIDRPAEGLSDIELHRVRILFKRLRYTCDFFRSLPGPDMGSLIGAFVAYQDCLGLHQDATTALRILAELLGEVVPEGRTEELFLSMGALLQLQRDAQRAQRQKFSGKWSSAAELPALWKKLRESLSAAG